MSSTNCCFLTSKQISQEAGQMVWNSHLFQNFPQFVVIHSVKGFGIVNKAVDVFLEFPWFLYDPTDVGNLISGSTAFSKPCLFIGKFLIQVLLKPSLKDFEHNLTSMESEHNCPVVWISFSTILLWNLDENLHFLVLWPLLDFLNLLAYWVQHLNTIYLLVF